MQSEDDELHVYFSIRSCVLVGNSSTLDNFLLIPLTKLLFSIFLRDMLTEGYPCCMYIHSDWNGTL